MDCVTCCDANRTLRDKLYADLAKALKDTQNQNDDRIDFEYLVFYGHSLLGTQGISL
jgi:hypothetical protein